MSRFVTIVLVVAVGGCGGGSSASPENEVKTAAQGFMKAVNFSDTAKACSYIGSEMKASWRKQDKEKRSLGIGAMGPTCQDNFSDTFGKWPQQASIKQVQVNGNQAIVSGEAEAGTKTVKLNFTKEPNGWKIEDGEIGSLQISASFG